MKRIALAVALVALAGSAAAAEKTYQVTGPVLDVERQDHRRAEGQGEVGVARTADTKVDRRPKKGDKVTVEYTMTATSIQLEEGQVSRDRRRDGGLAGRAAASHPATAPSRPARPAVDSPPMLPERTDVLVVGGGIIGLTIARELAARRPARRVVLEKEPDLGQHASGRNSGVLHAGIYYAPDSSKARTCLSGNKLMRAFCKEKGLPVLEAGKVIVARTEEELPTLEELHRRAPRTARASGSWTRRSSPSSSRWPAPSGRRSTRSTPPRWIRSGAPGAARRARGGGGPHRHRLPVPRPGRAGPRADHRGEIRFSRLVNAAGARSRRNRPRPRKARRAGRDGVCKQPAPSPAGNSASGRGGARARSEARSARRRARPEAWCARGRTPRRAAARALVAVGGSRRPVARGRGAESVGKPE